MDGIIAAIISTVGGLLAVFLTYYLSKEKKKSSKSQDKSHHDKRKSEIIFNQNNNQNNDNFENKNDSVDTQNVLNEDDYLNGKSNYVSQKCEDKRLQIQNNLLETFDESVYQETFESIESPLTILDVGCGSGNMLVPKIAGLNVKKFVGIDKSQRQIILAKNNYESDHILFECLDVESTEFEVKLQALMSANGIKKFNIINLSMILLHVNDPINILTILHSYLSKDGKIIIRDIDDGINFAYPDPNNWFDRLYKLCYRDEQSGNRHNGRKIYYFLKKSGYEEISLKRQGLSSDEMNLEQKDAFYNMYFKFVIDNSMVMYNKYPDNKEIEEDFQWATDNSELIYKMFMEEDFIFSLGFLTYVAQK